MKGAAGVGQKKRDEWTFAVPASVWHSFCREMAGEGTLILALNVLKRGVDIEEV